MFFPKDYRFHRKKKTQHKQAQNFFFRKTLKAPETQGLHKHFLQRKKPLTPEEHPEWKTDFFCLKNNRIYFKNVNKKNRNVKPFLKCHL